MSFSVEKSLKIEIIQYWTTYIRWIICIHEGNYTPDGVTWMKSFHKMYFGFSNKSFVYSYIFQLINVYVVMVILYYTASQNYGVWKFFFINNFIQWECIHLM